ncbi:sigma-70 family RNA polymerase sigma factor [Mycolicibacterium rufum]|uniref:Sigma-70 family RNA polymerase sigma factor n=1 Tax=Mycolicibacterium rufum TaxID=318424 RepID=A0A9X2XW89_9MYCO|nr:sigma-70 family RNA polymerase sigma factor [Mycolicibacterium rufum]KGI70359.1 RNA polymerase subunit sigma-24 [Mycolicibacterium rufum]MCV7070292.1 sigma-70 family RNA polymerase sigma factor [Mycolicibacterium rufum]ULP36672.1 sigma-70 family RNA polymerase sigma factor [Mycolicibacterium rufum]
MTTTDQLAVRFTRDAVPLLTGLRGHAVRLTRDPDLADDLLQETAAKAFAAFANFTEGTNLAGWLYRIMLNTHIGEYRKGQRRPALQFTDAISDTQMLSHHQRATSARSPEDDVLVRLGDPVIAAAMRALPEVYRTAVYYADVEGLTFKEIAARLDVPLGTVMSRLHRGRTQLRRALRDTARAVGYSLPDAA